MAITDLSCRMRTLNCELSPALFPDTVIVYPPTYGTDDDSGPTQADGAGVPIAAMVAPSGDAARSEDHETPHGVTGYTVKFKSDPGIRTADIALDWMTHAGGEMSPVIRLTTTGAATPPSGLGVLWQVACVHRA